MNNNSAIKITAFLMIVMPQLIKSMICAGTQYWNPLDNSCVECKLLSKSRVSMALSLSLLCGSIDKYLCKIMPN